MNSDDAVFVHSSWHTSYWKLFAKKLVSRPVYITEQDRRIDRLLSKSMTLIAYFPEAPDEILGWACIDTRANCAHYVYVKVPYRRLGIGTGLVRNRATCYSHGTDKVGQLFATHNNLTFNPYLVER